MIHRKKDLTNPPSGLMHSKWDKVKKLVLTEKNTHEEKAECYRDQTIEDLCLLYSDKCAICERSRGTELQVDHYRPRKARNHIKDAQYNQPGYYWLTYEWSNLLPLCSKCNNKKSNKFPLQGWKEDNRIKCHDKQGESPYDFDWLQQKEFPLLINPEYENYPEKHFIFLNDGTIKGRSDQGKETINTFKLNRKSLIAERKKFLKDYSDQITFGFDEYVKYKNSDELRGSLKQVFNRIRVMCAFDSPFSLYHVFIYRYFEYFVGSKLHKNIASKAISYFEDFKINYAL